jgi:hypothetical protein
METNQLRKPLAVSALMSPPEATPYERFPHAAEIMSSPTAGGKSSIDKQKQLPLQFLSPPVSPETLTTADPSAASTSFNTRIRDPILYPPTSTDTSSIPQPPLFAPTQQLPQPPQSLPQTPQQQPQDLTARLVDQHISRARRKHIFHTTSPPHRADYLLALEFRSQVMRMYTADRAAWLARERGYLLDGQRARAARAATISASSSPSSNSIVVSRQSKTYPPLAPSPGGVQRPRAPPKQRKVRRDRTATPDAPSRSRNTGTSTREDKDFESIPDLCPPLSSLPSRPNALKVEWKGAPLDLSRDPHRHLLHPDEIHLAANLRLDCATYLTSKRRIFVARRECWLGTWNGGRGKKEFRKTDAQQACKIDVNKASKLWMAFERVGWLEERWCTV